MENKRQRKRPKRNPLDYVIFSVSAILIVFAGAWIGLSSANEYSIDIQMSGPAELTLEYGSEYTDAGATAQCYGSVLKTEPFSLEVKTESNVDTSKVGSYKVIYTASHGRQSRKLERTVQVVDTQPPVITLVSDPEKFTFPGQTYEEEGFTATDGYDGDLTAMVERIVTDTEVIYTVADSSGNTAEIRRTIVFKDPIAPVLTLLGDTEITIDAGSKYSEPGYTATDNCDGDIKHLVNITGNVNIWAAGTYTITYTVSDSFGNTVTATRTVKVKAKETGGGDVGGGKVDGTGKTIYLTFDDGPSDYTLKLLDVLAKYNVKATFFVTGSAKLDYLPKIAAAGHSIGLHSATHRYEQIYASEDAFFADLYKIQSLVEQRLGYKIWLMRFPGGASNRVSAKYDGGIKIMSRLTKSVVDQGFYYYDWNVDSDDAVGAKTTAEVLTNLKKGIRRAMKDHGYALVLQHDTQEFSIQAVEEIIKWGKANGYKFLTLQENSPASHHDVSN